MAKVSVSLDDDLDQDKQTEKVRKLAAPLPSVSKAKSFALKDAPRVQFAFTNVPKPIKEAFVAAAKKRRITQKEFLYECLRAGGLDIPSNEEIDGRRR